MTIYHDSKYRPMCSECNTKPARKGGTSVHGFQLWAKLCGSCENKKYRKARQVDLTCSLCDWVAVDSCQIDVVDGKSVCACCNRLRMKKAKHRHHEDFELTVDSTVNLDDVRL